MGDMLGYNDMIYPLPSGSQTWLAGKCIIYFDAFPSYKPPFCSGIFQPAMFDSRVAEMEKTSPRLNMFPYPCCRPSCSF